MSNFQNGLILKVFLVQSKPLADKMSLFRLFWQTYRYEVYRLYNTFCCNSWIWDHTNLENHSKYSQSKWTERSDDQTMIIAPRWRYDQTNLFWQTWKAYGRPMADLWQTFGKGLHQMVCQKTFTLMADLPAALVW